MQIYVHPLPNYKPSPPTQDTRAAPTAAHLVPSTWYQVLGSKYLVPCTWFQALGLKYLYQEHGTKNLIPSTWYQELD